MKNPVLKILLVICLLSSLLLGVWSNAAVALTAEQRLFEEAWKLVHQTYLDDSFNHQDWDAVRTEALKQPFSDRTATYQAIRKMLASLDDPYTRFLDPEGYRNLQVSTSGELTGVGLQITLDLATGEVLIIAPIAGSPADRAGLLSGDRILAIDEQATPEMSLDQAAALMRGRKGTVVQLTVAREDNPPQVYDLVRDVVSLSPVIAQLDQLDQDGDTPTIGYLRLLEFNGNSSADLAQAIEDLAKQGAEAYILDLRNNPGGLLDAGIEIAREWIDYGTIVYTVDRWGTLGMFQANGRALTDAPLVVLVNQGSASASEILAGALHDNLRAQLVGETTFGKGLIQSLFRLSDGSGLAVTVAKYETPLHTDINEQGIKPDYVVPFSPLKSDQWGSEVDLEYQKAVKLLSLNF